jgi:hypothetical protein
MEMHKDDTKNNLKKYWIDAELCLPDDPNLSYISQPTVPTSEFYQGGIPVQVAIEATDTFCGFRFENTFYENGWNMNKGDVIKYWKPNKEAYPDE